MTRMITIQLARRTVQIKPHWAGKGIAIHKSIHVDEDGQVSFRPIQGYWLLTHIPTGMSLGCCMGSLDRAKGFAKAWDAEFAVPRPGEAMAPDRLQAWGRVMEEMKTEPPRVRRGAVLAAGGRAMSSWNPEANRQDAIGTACHNAIRAVVNEAEAAHREQRSFDDRLALAAALEAIEQERTADHPGLSLPFSIQDCIDHLRATASPRRGEP